MTTVTSVYDEAALLLAECEAALATTTGGVPDRSYVAASLPAFDCPEQLTVHVQGINLDVTSPLTPAPVIGLRHAHGARFIITFVVTVIRCTPQPNGLEGAPPSPAQLETLAAKVQQDLWATWNHLWQKVKDGTLFRTCEPTYFDAAVPSVESGAAAGWQLVIRGVLEGYVPVP
jgi:hypothetical protein